MSDHRRAQEGSDAPCWRKQDEQQLVTHHFLSPWN